ncbi:MAG: circularly permuted type 2 ATP-grasp protein, partial [Bosea sp. (in: a-proteobacteria)]
QQRQLSNEMLNERRAQILARYQPLVGAYDELLTPNGDVRPGWSNFVDAWASFSPDELTARFGIADRHVRDAGVSYRVHGDARDPQGSTERAWPLSQVPLVITGQEWQQIAAGVVQRATLAERLIGDIYGPGQLFADGILPGTVVSGSSDYLRPLHDVSVPGGRHLSIYAADLGRGPDGKWWVLGDRTQAPSGSGYALENRLALARAFPDLHRGLNVERLAPFFQSFRAGLVAGAQRSDPRICLLTPGPLSESYFEQAYLARYLGFMLVEGADLVMRDDKLHVRTIAGLKRADVLWRRVDGDFMDPLELNAMSALGVPGLLQAMRKGTLVVANSPGSGVIESRALMSFMPALAKRLLGEELLLPNTATWWCGQQAARDTVLARLDEMSVAAAFHSSDMAQAYHEPVLAAEMGSDARAMLAQQIADHGLDLVGQDVVKLSTLPVWQDGSLQARPFTLRV